MKHTKKFQHDQFAFVKFLMAFLILIAHYEILIGSTMPAVNKIPGSILRRFFHILFEAGREFGLRLPICFFVISGFLSYRQYFSKIKEREMNFYKFMYRRIVRLYPLLILSVLFMTLGQWFYFYQNSSWWTGRANELWRVIQALSGISVGTFMNSFDAVNGPIWYISVLLICYILYWFFSFFCAGGGGKGFLCIVFIGMAVQAYGWNLPFLTSQCSVGYIGFFSGVLLALILERDRLAVPVKRTAYICISCFVFLIFLYRSRFQFFMGGDSNWICFGFFIPMMILTDQTKIKKYMSNMIFDFLGKLSFPVYLLQLPTFCMCAVLLPQSINKSDFLFWLITGILMLESLIWTAVEGRIENYIKKFLDRMTAVIKQENDRNWR